MPPTHAMTRMMMDTHSNRWRALGALLLSALTLIGGCGGAADDGEPRLRLINASAGYDSLDLYVDGSQVSSGITQSSAGDYVHVSTDDSHTFKATRHGSVTALVSQPLSRGEDTSTALIAYGWEGSLKLVELNENEAQPGSGVANLQVLNAASGDVPSVDIYLTGSDEDLAGATPVASAVTDVSGGYLSVDSGTYRLRVTAAGSTSDVRLDVAAVALGSRSVNTLVLSATSGGALVNGLQVVQQGSVTALANTQARLRVVAAVSDNGVVNAALSGTVLASAAKSPSIGSYTPITAGSVAPTLTVDDSAVRLPAGTLSAGGDYTLLVWGPASAPQTTLVSDDNRLPTSSTGAKLRLVHALSDLSDTLSLTADYAAIADNLAQGSASTYGSLTAGSSTRLDVTTPTLSSAIYSATDVTIAAKGVYTVFMFGTRAAPVGVLRKER